LFRIDVDGQAYTEKSFEDVYRTDGNTRFHQAVPVPGGENAVHMSPEEIESSDAVRRAKTKTPKTKTPTSATVKPTKPTTAQLTLVGIVCSTAYGRAVLTSCIFSSVKIFAGAATLLTTAFFLAGARRPSA